MAVGTVRADLDKGSYWWYVTLVLNSVTVTRTSASTVKVSISWKGESGRSSVASEAYKVWRGFQYSGSGSGGSDHDVTGTSGTYSYTFTDTNYASHTGKFKYYAGVQGWSGSSTAEERKEYSYTIPAATCTVTFNGNNGTPASSTKTETYGSKYTLPSNPTRTGYNFNGWWTSASGGSQVTTNTTVTNASNHTLYAHWTAKSYKVTFNPNGGTTPLAEKYVTYKSTYGTLPTPTKTGTGVTIVFEGWFTAQTGGTQIISSTTVNITAAQTLYAHWKTQANSYTLTYNANGGTCSKDTQIVAYGSQLGDFPTPTKTGYNWTKGSNNTGWYNQNFTTEYKTTDTMPANNLTIYAKWTAKTVTATFSENYTGGSSSTKTETYDSKYVVPANPTRNGYVFLGWYTEASGGSKVTTDTTVTKTTNHTLYAHWEPLSILHLVQSGTVTTVTNIKVVESGTVKNVIGVYSVSGGVVKQGI